MAQFTANHVHYVRLAAADGGVASVVYIGANLLVSQNTILSLDWVLSLTEII